MTNADRPDEKNLPQPSPNGETDHAANSAETEPDKTSEVPDLPKPGVEPREVEASGETEILTGEQNSETVSPGENAGEVTESIVDKASDEKRPASHPPSDLDEIPKLKQEIDQLRQQLDREKELKQQLEQQLHQHEDRIGELTKQLTGKEQSDMKPEPSKELEQLIVESCRKDKKDRNDDTQELAKHQDQMQRLLDLSKTLRQGITETIDQCASLLPACRSARDNLPPELQAQIQTRHNALELIGRMVDRLRETIGKLSDNPDLPAPAPAEVKQQELIALLNEAYRSSSGTIDMDMLKKAVDKKLKEVSNQRYQQITETRSLVEAQRSQLLNLVKQKILPILDGLYEGQHHSEKLIQVLANSYPAQQDTLNQWLKFHSDLHSQIQRILSDIGIHPMQVQPGDAADYNRHFPLGVEPEPALDSEHVKEVSQQGYEYTLEADQPAQVLRPAQVIMVKN
jgi:hypothetical protein